MENYSKILSFNLVGSMIVALLVFITINLGEQPYSLKELVMMAFMMSRENLSILILSLGGSLIATTLYQEINKKNFTMYQLFYDGFIFIWFSYVIIWIIGFLGWTIFSKIL